MSSNETTGNKSNPKDTFGIFSETQHVQEYDEELQKSLEILTFQYLYQKEAGKPLSVL